MKTIKINVPLTVHYESLPPSVDGEATQKRIESRWGAVSVSVSGSREAVDHMLSVCPTNDPPTLIQRALSALGYVVGDYEKDVAEFSRWVDHLAAFPQSEEALELWTNATLAGLPAGKTVYEASKDAQAVIVQRMRLFPPAPKTGLNDGPILSDVIGVDLHISAMKVANEHIRLWVDLTGCKTPKDAAVELARLREWEKAARQRGWNSPLDLRGRTAADDVELGQWRDAAKANGITSPNELVQSANINFGQFVDRRVTREWREATGCQDPATAKERIKQLRAGYDSADAERSQLKRDAEQRERAWVNTTDRHCPGDAEQRIDDLRMQVEIQAETIHAWEKETKCKSPEDASKLDELAKTWQDSSTRYEYIAKQRAREISEWVAKSGVAYPDELVEKFRVTEDAWKEATGAADTHAAYKKIADLESKILSYASEIDALRKLASPKRDWDAELGLAGAEHRMRVAAERELAKIKAELDSKRRECQTEKERADKAEHDANNLRVIYSDARASAGLPLQIGEGENLSKWCSDAREKLSRAIIPLPKPEKVEPGQKWAFVMKAIDKGSSPPRVVGTFIDSNGSSWCAYQSDLDTGFYLGT